MHSISTSLFILASTLLLSSCGANRRGGYFGVQNYEATLDSNPGKITNFQQLLQQPGLYGTKYPSTRGLITELPSSYPDITHIGAISGAEYEDLSHVGPVGSVLNGIKQIIYKIVTFPLHVLRSLKNAVYSVLGCSTDLGTPLY